MQAIFKFRGMCFEVDKMDTDYILSTETIETGNYIFRGLAGLSSIVFNRCQFHQHFTSSFFVLCTKMFFKAFFTYSFCFNSLEKGYWKKAGCEMLMKLTPSRTLNVWEIRNDSLGIIGFYSGSSPFPVGSQSWFLRIQCKTTFNDFSQTQLKFSKVTK